MLWLFMLKFRKVKKIQKHFGQKLQHGLNDFKGQLPSGVMTLTADNDFGNTSAILLAVESETKTYKELEKYIEKFEDDARTIPSTSRVKHFGLQKEVINVYIDDSKLTNYAIKPILILSALKPQSAVNYSGEIDDGKFIRPIHVNSGYKTENDIANQIIFSGPTENVIRVKDVARVVREYEEPSSYIRLNGKKCLIVSLEMLPGHNIVQYGDEVKEKLRNLRMKFHLILKWELFPICRIFVSKSIYNFLKEFGLAILSVILVTVLLYPEELLLLLPPQFLSQF